MKWIISLVLLSIFLTSCGVDTSSSDGKSAVSIVDDLNTIDDANLINPGLIVDGNQSSGSDDGSDDGSGDDGDTQNNVNVNQSDSIFDISGAVEDEFACAIGDINDGFTNNVLKDNSNDYLGAMDLEDGLGITSRYPYNENTAKSEVVLYYYDLKPVRTFQVITVLGDKYTLSIDTAWAENDEKVVYVKTPIDSDGLYGCYRYDLSSIDIDSDVDVTKVYRLN